VYFYTNSRILNQNVTYKVEATREWYKQCVVSEDSDSEGPANLFDDYNDVSNFDSPSADMDGMSTDDDNTKGQSQE
jgi:hypothetical protein